MTENDNNNVFSRFIVKLKAHIVSDVPIELDACEDCRVTECSHEKLVHCENRIRRAKQIEDDLNRMNGKT